MIATARLRLRPPRAGDLHALHAIMADPRAMRFWGTPPHADIAQTRDFLAAMLATPRDGGEELVIERDGGVIGRVALWRIAEVGFFLHPDHWRQGLMREALGAALPHFFARFPDVDRITADTDPQNAAALGLLAALGFVETGRADRTFRVDGVWSGSVYLALDRPADQPGVIR